MSQSNDSIRRRNPYIIGRPITEPELFFGRDSLFDFIEDNLQQGSQVILLHGQRRIGKSSVLAQIPQFVKLKNFVFVPLSLEGDSRKSIGTVLHELARDSVEQFEALKRGEVRVPSSEEFQQNPRLFLTDFLPALRKGLNTQNIVLLLDEFDTLSESPMDVDDAAGHLFPFLQQGVYESPNLFVIPVVGRQLDDLSTMMSLFREAPTQEVGLLDRRSAERLITVPARGVLDYEADAIDAILELSAGHPYFTQVVCFALFANAREDDRWKVTRSDVKLIVDRAIELGGGGLGWFWEGIPLPERVVFAAAAEIPRAKQLEYPELSSLDFTEIEPLELLRECGVQLTDCLRDSVFHLVEWKFLRPTGIRMGTRQTSMPPTISTYRASIELVRRWLIKQHPVRDAIWELEELDPKAQELFESAKIARQYGTTPAIVTRLNEVLKINPNHFGALFELAKSYAELQQFPQALKIYKRAHQVNSVLAQDAYVQVLYDYGEELYRQGELDRAIAQLEEAIEIEPDNSEVDELLQQVRRAKEYDTHLKVIPITAGIGAAFVEPEMTPEEIDMRALRQTFKQLWDQVEENAPEEVKHRALEHLTDLQEEIFGKKAVDGLTLLYVYRWFSNHLPEPLVQAVTEFVDHVTALIGRQRDLKKRDDRSA